MESPDLPVTWRPLGVRLAVVFFGLMLLVVCLFAWLGFDQSTRDAFSIWQKLTLLLLGVLIFGSAWVVGRCRITAREDGITVVNGLRTYTYAWDEVRNVDFQPGYPWARLTLDDESQRQVIGLRASDGLRTERAVMALRGLIADRRA
ncbi:MAG: PH domain-containing protein [Nocardioides sp.]|uniref:PH domain-containing protein n=1 Tax=Nocardioides sp. TaxID=35761 RepID=UPI003F05D5A0